MSTPTEPVVNNTTRSRFEVINGSQLSKLDYRLDEEAGTIDIIHTEVPEELAGQGIGSALVTTALRYAREHGLKAVLSCPFAVGYVARHPEWKDVVTDA